MVSLQTGRDVKRITHHYHPASWNPLVMNSFS